LPEFEGDLFKFFYQGMIHWSGVFSPQFQEDGIAWFPINESSNCVFFVPETKSPSQWPTERRLSICLERSWIEIPLTILIVPRSPLREWRFPWRRLWERRRCFTSRWCKASRVRKYRV
jgi:hypothetical protein